LKATWHYIAISYCIKSGTWPPCDRLP